MRHLLVPTLLLAAALVAPPPAPAQATRVMLRFVGRTRIGPLTTVQTLGLSGANQPNGRGYRLRESVPARLPAWVARELEGMRLTIADSTADGWLAFYRSPAGESEPRNARFLVRLTGFGGRVEWTLPLNPLLARGRDLEVTDVRYGDGHLYFNESCQSYSREAGGRCSALVRVDPRRGEVEWRTQPLVSNDIFLLDGPWIIAGYGFTAEADYVRVLDRASGRVLAAQRLDSAPDYLEFHRGLLYVTTAHTLYRFRIGGQ